MREPNTASASPARSGCSRSGRHSGAYCPSPWTSATIVEALLDGVVKADLLIAAVALVDRVEQNRHGKRHVGEFAGAFKGVVRGGIVDNQDMGVVPRQGRVDAPEDVLDGRLGVVGDDEDEDALHSGRRCAVRAAA